MDNWSIHWTINVKHKLKEFVWKIIMLPSYTPESNPIELYFDIIIRKFWKQAEDLIIKTNDDYGVSQLKEVIVTMMREEIIKWFIKTLKRVKLHFSYSIFKKN